MPTETGRRHKRHICANHNNVAMGEVQHPGDAVNHRVTEGNNRIDATQAYA
jgi:hypothetical protein